MPMYPYEAADDSGDTMDVFYHMQDAPPCGHTITRDGRKWTKVFGSAQVSAAVSQQVHGFPYVSEGSCCNAPGAGSYTEEGQPIITSRLNQKEFLAANKDDGMRLD